MEGREQMGARQGASGKAGTRQGANEGTEDKRESGYLESLQKVTPPICGATSALYPHNFSHQKSRKKSPWSDWKKFRKKFVGKCFGVKGKPPILWKGGEGVLKYERLVQR